MDGDGEVSAVETQLAERTEDLQRVTAEYANYRRRTERERQGIIDTARAGVVTQLLPLLDDLDLAEQHGDLNEGPLKSLSDKLINILGGLKVESFGEIGEDSIQRSTKQYRISHRVMSRFWERYSARDTASATASSAPQWSSLGIQRRARETKSLSGFRRCPRSTDGTP